MLIQILEPQSEEPAKTSPLALTHSYYIIIKSSVQSLIWATTTRQNPNVLPALFTNTRLDWSQTIQKKTQEVKCKKRNVCVFIVVSRFASFRIFFSVLIVLEFENMFKYILTMCSIKSSCLWELNLEKRNLFAHTQSSYMLSDNGDPVSFNQGKNSSFKVSEEMGPTALTPGISHHWAQGGGEGHGLMIKLGHLSARDKQSRPLRLEETDMWILFTGRYVFPQKKFDFINRISVRWFDCTTFQKCKAGS